MKHFLFVCCCIAAFSCNKSSDNNVAISGKWTMVSVSDATTGQTFTRPAGTGDVLVEFAGTSSGGTLTGQTPANVFEASRYSLGSNHEFSITALSCTQVYEQTWGSFFLDNISLTSRYDLVRPSTLLLSTPTLTLKFKRN